MKDFFLWAEVKVGRDLFTPGGVFYDCGRDFLNPFIAYFGTTIDALAFVMRAIFFYYRVIALLIILILHVMNCVMAGSEFANNGRWILINNMVT